MAVSPIWLLWQLAITGYEETDALVTAGTRISGFRGVRARRRNGNRERMVTCVSGYVALKADRRCGSHLDRDKI